MRKQGQGNARERDITVDREICRESSSREESEECVEAEPRMVGVRGPASFSIRLVRKKDVSGIWPKNIGPLESCLTFPFFF